MAISNFQNFGCLTPKNHNFDVSKINVPKIHFFIDILETEIYVIELCVTNSCTKFEANILIFCREMVQKPIDRNGVIFLNSVFGISNCRTAKQIAFLDSRRQN